MDDFCHVCFSSGHIASECPNSMKKTKTKNFKVKSNNIKNDFSTLIASSFKENSNCDLKSKNFENEISVLKQKLEESEENLKIERIDFDKSFYKMQKSLMISDVTIEELENEVVTIKSERDIFSEKLTCVQNNLSMSENSNFELEKKVVTLNKEISLLKQKLDDSDNKPSEDVINTNDDKWNFTSFSTTFNDCDIFADDFVFDFRDDELTFNFEGDAEINYDKKFRELLNDCVSKRKENSNFLYKINELEKEVKFLKSCLGESEKKLEMQNFVFEEKLMNSQSKYLSSLKDLDLQRAEFLEKLKESQIKFLSCEKARKDLEVKIITVTSELENYKSISHKFTNGSQGLDKLLSIGKNAKDRSGLGFDKFASSSSASQITFVKSANGFENSKLFHNSKDVKFQKSSPRVFKKEKEKVREISLKTPHKKFVPICHFCGAKGHIRPNCYKLLNDKSNFHINVSNKFDVLMKEIVRLNKAVNRKSPDNFINSKQPVSKKVWIRKDSGKSNALDASKKVWTKNSDFKCNVAHVNVNDHKSKPWYFDSACASHMSSDKSCFENLKSSNDCSVIFGNGSSAKVLGKGTISISGIPKVDDSLLVDGLNVNLLSISKICDNDLSVIFTKTKCEVFNEKGECVLKGQRMLDNCYCVVPSTKPLDHICFEYLKKSIGLCTVD